MRVAIQDYTGSDEISYRPLIRMLRRAGYGNVYIAKSLGLPLKVTRIVAQQGDGDSAESVRTILGLGEVRVESTGNLNSDISVQVGQDYLEQREMLSNPVQSQVP